VAKVTWSSVGQQLIPQGISPGIAFGCWLATCRIVTTWLLLLEDLKIRRNCTDKSGDYTRSRPSKSHGQSVYLCLCVAVMKSSVPISVSEMRISQTWLQLLKWVESNTTPFLYWSLQQNCILLTNIAVALLCSDFLKNNLIGQTPRASFSTLWSVFTVLPHSENDSDKTTKFRALVFYVLRWCSYK